MLIDVKNGLVLTVVRNTQKPDIGTLHLSENSGYLGINSTKDSARDSKRDTAMNIDQNISTTYSGNVSQSWKTENFISFYQELY